MELFDRLRVGMIIHCGDVGDIGVFDEMAGRNCRFVWGNMDDPAGSVRAYVKTLAIPAPDEGGTAIDVDGKRLLVFHGHEPAFRRALLEGEADYILHGHTHEPRDERIGDTRVINPGALHRANRHSVATLDTDRDHVKFYAIDA